VLGNTFERTCPYGDREFEFYGDIALKLSDKRFGIRILDPSSKISEYLIDAVLLHHRYKAMQIIHQLMRECVIEQMIGRDEDYIGTFL